MLVSRSKTLRAARALLVICFAFLEKYGLAERGKFPYSLMRQVRSLVVDIAHKLRQVDVSEHLSNSRILARVIPIVVDDPLEEIASGIVRLPVIEVAGFLELLGGECVEERIGDPRNRMPGLPH